MFRRQGVRLARTACVISSFVFTLLAFNVDAAESRAKRSSLSATKLHTSALRYPNREIQVFVRLDEPAVAELNAQSMEQSGRFAAAEQQKAQAARVTAQQSAFKPVLQSLGARILAAQRVGANGFRVLVRPSEIESLRQLPGVRSVGLVKKYKLDNSDSVPWVGAPAVWNTVGKGQGVKIGIIDSGIDYTHATFGGSGNPADYAANDPQVIEPGSFPLPGGAVKGGIDLAGATYDADDPDSTPTPDPDPLDGGGHGTHVAATAAGRGVPGSVSAGVAPGADLYAIKIFGDAGGTTLLVSAGIEWAMDPNGDGDMSDHMDVINMSVGAPWGSPDDPGSISAENAAKLGIIVVASAGNEGPSPYVTGDPAVAPSAISVAASIPGGRLYARLTVTAPESAVGTYPSVEGAGPVTFQTSGPVTGMVMPASPLDGCAPLTNDVAGKIALIVRGGTCGFLVKYQNAQAAGARAIVVYNDGTAADRQEPIIMGGLNASVTIPGLMISFANGVKLRDSVNVQATIEAARDATRDDAISAFSSLGPGIGASSFKPDLTAPGTAIVSAAIGSGTGALALNGTSMSAPHVAGAAALLRQQHPELNQSDIKALLQNSTANANTFIDTRLTRQGTGVLRVDRASKLTSFAKPGGVSFGRLNPVLPIVRSEKIRVTNLGNKPRTYSGKHIANRSVPGVTVVCPGSVTVGGSRSARAEIFLKFDPIASARRNVSDDGAVSQREVDGWCVLSDGKDELRIGYIAVVDPASSVIVTSSPSSRKAIVRNLGPADGLAEGFTLAKAGGESTSHSASSIAAVGFRRADPAVYGGKPVLEFGVATEAPFNHLSFLIFDMLIDTNKDGTPEFELLGIDASAIRNIDPGTFITARVQGDEVTPDWVVNTWDFNDRVFILPFTLAAGGGLLPDKFDYELHLISRDGNQDVQRGSVDLSKEIVPDLNSFSVGAGEKVEVQLSGGKGLSLWLLQNNPLFGQFGITATK